MSCGAFSDTMPATPKIQAIADQVKSELEGKENKMYPVFVATKYRSQVVAGINYLIKVFISKSMDECVHLMVFQSLPCHEKDFSLTNYQTHKTKDAPLELFY